jgi:hypothetical protein
MATEVCGRFLKRQRAHTMHDASTDFAARTLQACTAISRNGATAKNVHTYKKTYQKQLHLESLLDISLAAHGLEVSGDERHAHAHDDAHGADEEREDQCNPTSILERLRGGANEHGRAARLAEGAKEIRAHASNVTDIVANVVRNARRVVGRVFVELLAVAHADHLAREVGTNIGSLGEDTASHASKHGNGRATETIPRHALKEALEVDFAVRLHHGTVHEAQEVQDHEREGTERVAHNAARTEGTVESRAPALLALLLRRHGGAGVGEHSHHHSNVARQDGRERTCTSMPNHEPRIQVRLRAHVLSVVLFPSFPSFASAMYVHARDVRSRALARVPSHIVCE